MTLRESERHLLGLSVFTDDLPLPENGLYAAVVVSPVANGVLESLDAVAARRMSGVAAILTAADLPGRNEIGDIVPDEPLLAEHRLNFIGKPVALVLAESPEQAQAAAAAVTVRCEALTPRLDVRESYATGHTFGDERQFRQGDPAAAFREAVWIVEGEVDTSAQEHLYFETQTALALPLDGDRIRVISATQNPSGVQKGIATILGIPMHAVEVEVPRLGGAFGGKEEQAKPWTALAALGAWKTRRPVRLTLTRQQDMQWTGKRHPYHARYRLGADAEGRVLAFDVQFLQNGGAVADLSTAILERTLFHATNAYRIPNASIKAVSCRTHHPSNTAFRGFGAPQAVFTIECALDHLARVMGWPREQLQHLNLLRPGDRFPYGMSVSSDSLQTCWDQLHRRFHIDARRQAIADHNRRAPRHRRGLALTPICFGIAFTATHLNQASVTVSLYRDASVGVAASAVEMGQGVTDKLMTVVSRGLGIARERVRLDYANSSKTANMSATAASVGTDLNGMAALKASTLLRDRLEAFAAGPLGLGAGELDEAGYIADGRVAIDWPALVTQAYLARIDLVAHAFHATPDLYFDRQREQGHPFAYHVFGVSAVEVSVDTLLGVASVERIQVVYDLGHSLVPQVDLGQMEGGLVQGVGYVMLEEVLRDDTGRVSNDRFATYKIPDLLSSPDIQVEFVTSDRNPYGPFSAKAIGEPPFLLGLGVFFAIAQALREARPELSLAYRLPLTPERILLALYPADEADAAQDPGDANGVAPA